MNLKDGVSMEEKEIVRDQMIDYYSFSFPEFNLKDLFENEPILAEDHASKVKFAIDVPDIQLEPKAKPEPQTAKPVQPTSAPAAAKPATAPAQEVKTPSPANAQPNVPKPQQSGSAQPGTTQPAPKPQQPAPQMPTNPPPPAVTKQDLEVVNQKLSEIYKILDGYVAVQDLGEFESRVEKMFNSSIDNMEEKIESFKRTVVPQRKQYETDILFKKNLYDSVCQILDDLLIPLFDATPDYNLLSFQSTQYFKDGSIANALVCINVVLSRGQYSHTFKVDVPILSGIINAPTFLTKGNKLVPLIKSEIQKELDSFSYMQAPKFDDQNARDSLFNVGEDQFVHRENNQKEYGVFNQTLQSLNPGSQFKVNVNTHSNNNEPDFNTSVNSPKYFPKY